MRKILRDPGNPFALVKQLRYIPFIDRLYQKSYPAHHEYEKHMYLVDDYGRVGIPWSFVPKPRTGPSTFQEIVEFLSSKGLEGLLNRLIIIPLAKIIELPGLLQPLVDMLKDAIDTVKPYKSGVYRQRDWYQPLDGVKNCITAILDILFAAILCAKMLFMEMPFCMIVSIIGLLYSPFTDKPGRIAIKSIAAFVATPFLLPTFAIRRFGEPILRFFRGITQIIFFPLTYIFKISIRHMLTPKNYKGMPTAEANNTIKMLVSKLQILSEKPAEEQTNDTTELLADDSSKTIIRLTKASMLHTVHFKYAKGQWKGKRFDPVVQKQEADLYQNFVDAKDQEIARKTKDPYAAQNVKDAQAAYETFVLNDLARAPQLVS